MNGLKITLDTTTNKNYVEDWRKVGLYDKESDSIKATSEPNTWVTAIAGLLPSLGKTGDFVTISFDCIGGCRIGGWTLSKEAFVRCEASGRTAAIYDHGIVTFSSPGKQRGVWVTYKLTQDKGPRFFVAVGAEGGTLYIRNIKVELSDHPTDYEDILKIDNLGGQ